MARPRTRTGTPRTRAVGTIRKSESPESSRFEMSCQPRGSSRVPAINGRFGRWPHGLSPSGSTVFLGAEVEADVVEAGVDLELAADRPDVALPCTEVRPALRRCGRCWCAAQRGRAAAPARRPGHIAARRACTHRNRAYFFTCCLSGTPSSPNTPTPSTVMITVQITRSSPLSSALSGDSGMTSPHAANATAAAAASSHGNLRFLPAARSR